MEELIKRLKNNPCVEILSVKKTSDVFTIEDAKDALKDQKYMEYDIMDFFKLKHIWYSAWKEFEKITNEQRSQKKRIGGMHIINLMRLDADFKEGGKYKINNNWQPFFCAFYNSKYKISYFEMRKKNNKRKHNCMRAA